jgi:hypothetical protein
MECELRLPAVDIVLSSKRVLSMERSNSIDDKSIEQKLSPLLGGLSFSLCMNDFKLNVYHPFSGEPIVHSFDDARTGHVQTRNALSMSFQSVSINVSRIRTLMIDKDKEFAHRIQLSIVARISKAQFQYDIRRVSEILTFPKIWYKRALSRRLFLGNDSLPTRIRTPSMVTRRLTALTEKTARKQAQILFAIQLQELHISMRMSTIMGIVEWNNKDISVTGRLTLTNQGKRTLNVSAHLKSSTFQAEQGIVGGLIRLKNLRTTGK